MPTVPVSPDSLTAPASRGVELSNFAARFTVAETIALRDARIREHVSYAIAGAFVAANLLTLAGVAYVFHKEDADLTAKIITPQDRIITANVIIAVVGATTVQLGALAITMGKYLFPKQK